MDSFQRLSAADGSAFVSAATMVGDRVDLPIATGRKFLKNRMYAMTIDILDTYTKCNPSFRVVDKLPQRVLTNPSEGVANNGADNEEANLICRVHDQIICSQTCYTILDLLGTGTFGQVFRCQKDGTKEVVAIKIIKNKAAYHSQGLLEIKIARLLNTTFDPRDERHIVRLLDSFEFNNHICLVFELLSMSLLDILTQNQFRGLPLSVVQRFTRQIIAAMVTLEDANIIHCDLKPENILLAPPKPDKRQSPPPALRKNDSAVSSYGLAEQPVQGPKNGGVGRVSVEEGRPTAITSSTPPPSLLLSPGIDSLDPLVMRKDKDKEYLDLSPAIVTPEVPSNSDKTAGNEKAQLKEKEKMSSDPSTSSRTNEQQSAQGGRLSVWSDVKVIDLGSACFEGRTMYSYIQSRFYRSPEVLLGVPYNGAIDMWSLACVCAEMYLGLPLFPGVSQHNQLTRIIEMMGYPPDSLIEGKNGSKYFSRVSLYPTGNGSSTYSSQSDKSHSPKELWGLPTQSQISQKYHLKTAEEYALETSTEIPILRKYLRYSKLDDVIMKCPLANKSRMSSEQKREEMLRRLCFLNFLEGLFKMNPFERWTAKQAANHPFITNAPFTGQFTPAVDPKINERKLAYFVQTQRRDNTVRGGSHLQGNAGSSLEGSSDGMHVFRPLQFRRLSEPLRISPAEVKEVRFEEYKNQGQGPSLQRGQSVRELDDQSATSQSQIRYQHQSLPYNSSQYMQQQQYLQRQLAHQQQYVDLQLIQQPEQYSAYSASTTEGVWASYTIKEQVAISSSNSHYMESLATPGSQSTSTMVRNSSSCDDLPSSAMMNGKGRSLMTGDSRDNSWSYNFNSNGRDSGEGGVNIPNSPGQQQLQQQHQLQQQSRSYMQNDTSTNLSYTKRSNLNQPRNDYRNNNHNNRMSPHQYQASNSQPLQQPHSNDQTKGHRGQQLQQQQVNSVRQQYPINQQQSQHQTQLRNSTQYNYSGPQTDTYNSGNRQVSGSMDSTSGSGFEGFGGSMTDVPLMMTDFGQALMRPELDERRRLHSMQPSGGQMQHDQHFNCDMPKGQMWMNQQQSQSFTRQRPSQLPYYPPQQVQHQQHLHQQLNQQSQHLNQNQTDSRNHKQQQQRMSSSQDKHDSRHLNDINLKELVRSKLPYNASSSDTVASSSAMSALSDRILAAGGGGRGDDHTDQGRSVSFAESKDSDTHNYVAQLVVTSRGSSGFLSGTNSPNQLEGHRNRVGSSGGGGERSSSGRNSNSNSNSDINTSDRKSPLKDVASRSISSDASNKTQGGVGDVTDALGDWDPFFGGDDFEMEEELDGRGEKKILPHSISATTSGSRSGSAAMSDRCSTDDGDIDPDVDESEWRSAGSRGNSADVNPTPELPYRKLV